MVRMEVGFLIRVCCNYSRRNLGSLLSEEAEIPSTQSFVLTKRACSDASCNVAFSTRSARSPLKVLRIASIANGADLAIS